MSISLDVEKLPTSDSSSEKTVAPEAPPDDKGGMPLPQDTERTGVVESSPEHEKANEPIRTRDFGFLPIPKKQRHDPNVGFKFTTLLNAVFGVASTFTVANLYYSQPLLIELANDFGTSYDRISNVPTLTQAGYAAGLLFVTPLGDMIRRRELLLALLVCAGSLTIGLAATKSLELFEALSFLSGIAAVTPQVMLPFAADLAPPHKRASAISIVLSGLLLGILIARVLGGIIGEFSSWRNVYWMSVGLHFLILIVLYFVLPDFPDKGLNLSYWQILFSMAKFAVTEPVLIQSCMIGLACSSVFSCFWVTLTFLLGGEPYNYNTLAIGLFGLIGMLGVMTSPFVGRFVDKLIPWFGTLFGLLGLLLSFTIYTGAGIVNIGAIVVTCFTLDVAQQLQQVSNSTRNFAINPAARARINSVYIISVFLGQVIGSSVGSRIFLQYGQRAAGGFCLALIGFALFALLVRGPTAKTWIGWTGDIKSIRRQPVPNHNDVERQAPPPSEHRPVPVPQEPNTAEDHALADEPEDETTTGTTQPAEEHRASA
ncbi:MFS general substrate transporter [Dacryopinax primogenitus]|uniref:MFS general substrate transporter n=1 Tax=Dacryopinax primogenitus (strain DJM 731) TaxID=1858805 RepID=M5GCB8_DACPD|nr:MFS general substrate transporter [Dacryopinax primogenitus]EJU06679.1 MFS general substrate transporter [Dacryopinax primogenitus]